MVMRPFAPWFVLLLESNASYSSLFSLVSRSPAMTRPMTSVLRSISNDRVLEKASIAVAPTARTP